MNDSHSLIIDYPIDYERFPLAKNAKIYKVELNKNEYITIPKSWFHWVFSEPNTLAISYEISYIHLATTSNVFYHSFKFNKPYKNTGNINNITYDNFINSSLDFNYEAIFSQTNDCSPVIKNDLTKYCYTSTLSNIISKNNSTNYYTYISYNTINEKNILYKLSNITTIIDKSNINDIIYKSNVWFTLDKTVNSGLHHDPYNNVIYVVDGKKTIYLFEPNAKSNLYIQDFSAI
jgi:hypothetical protein